MTTGARSLDTIGEGLRVISEPLTGVRSVALGLWIGVGSRFERPAESGVSHFIEHLLFKGTERFSAAEIAEVFDGLGGEINAATGRDHTVVFTRVLDDHLETAFDVVADMLQNPAFDELDQERQVVLEEILMYEDDPGDLVHDVISQAVFPDQPLGRPVIGTSEVIASIGADAIRAYHRGHYVAPNMVVAASGSVDQARLVELSEKYLGGLAAGNGAGGGGRGDGGGGRGDGGGGRGDGRRRNAHRGRRGGRNHGRGQDGLGLGGRLLDCLLLRELRRGHLAVGPRATPRREDVQRPVLFHRGRCRLHVVAGALEAREHVGAREPLLLGNLVYPLLGTHARPSSTRSSAIVTSTLTLPRAPRAKPRRSTARRKHSRLRQV